MANPRHDPFAGFGSDGDDDTNTGTFVSMDEFRVTPSIRGSLPNFTASHHSSAAVLDPDTIGDHELLHNVTDTAYNRPVQDTSAFMWDLGEPSARAEDVEEEPPLQNSQTINVTPAPYTDNASHRTATTDMGPEAKSTPRVIRQMFKAMKTPRSKRESEIAEEPSLSVSDAVTSFSIPNPFKATAPYANLANPDAEESSLILFSRNGPAGRDEINALCALATGNSSPLSRVVEMFAYTVEFQNHELTTLKHNEIDFISNDSDVQHRMFSELDRQRSLTIRLMLEDLDKKDARIDLLEMERRDFEKKWQSELNFNKEFRAHCEGLDPSIRFSDGVEQAFEALNTYLHGNRRQSEMTMTAQKIELEEYAERLLDLEKKVSDGQRRQDALLKENTALKVELASSQNTGRKCESSNCETPAVHCHNTTLTLDTSAMMTEVETLTKESEELRKELRDSHRQNSKLEDDLFKARIDLDESRAKVKSLKSQFEEAEANVKLLKNANVDLEEHSRQISKELSQNTIDAVKELDKKEMEVKHLRFELADRDQAMTSYRETISHLEKQINASTKEAISRGMSVASGEESPSAVQERKLTDRAVLALQKEIDSARELLEARCSELDHTRKELQRLVRDMKLTEEELAFWKAQVTNMSREAELRESDSHNIGRNQEGDFLRRLSMQLGCRAENKRDLISKLVKRVEDFMTERGVFEEANEKLHAEIVDRERTLHVLRSEFESEISSLKCEVMQLENARDRAISEREAVETKLMEIANVGEDQDFDTTIDVTGNSMGMSFGNGSPSIRRQVMFDDDDVHWNDTSIDAAVKAVGHLVGVKNSIASRNKILHEKLNNLLSGTFGKDGKSEISRELILESRSLQEELVSIIGQQQQAIRKLKAATRVKFADAREGEDHSVNFSQYGDDDVSVTITDTHDFTSQSNEGAFASSKLSSASPVAMRRLSKATSFLRDQLDEMRTQLTEKMNANAELSTVIKDMEQRMEIVMGEKRSIEARVSSLSNLHENFVHRLGELCNVRPSPVIVESCVRDLIGTVSSLQASNDENSATSARRSERVYKLLAQKRILEHIIGIYQRNYQLDVLALPPTAERQPVNRLRGVFKSVLAMARLKIMHRNRTKQQPVTDFMDASAVYNLPIQLMIGESRDTYLAMTSASIAITAVPKLQSALQEREEQIAELRRSLATLNTAFPSTEKALMGHGQPSTFDYSQDIIDRKNDIARRLKKAINEKEELEVRLSHEKQHRTASEVRANKYLEKASKLHSKLQTVKLTAENRERTYKAAIRYLKQKADSAIDVELDENLQPNQLPGDGTEMPNTAPSKENKMAFAQVLHGQMKQAVEELERMQPGSAEYKKQSTYILGLKNATRRLRKTTAGGSSARRSASGTGQRESAMNA